MRHPIQIGITLLLLAAGRPRVEVARRWMARLRDATRRVDPGRPITVGLGDWNLDRPRAPCSGTTPEAVAAEPDFVAVHLDPQAGRVDAALDTLRAFRAAGEPVVVDETFPLACTSAEFARFGDAVRDTSAGLIGFSWEQDRAELQRLATIPAASTDAWLGDFESRRPGDR